MKLIVVIFLLSKVVWTTSSIKHQDLRIEVSHQPTLLLRATSPPLSPVRGGATLASPQVSTEGVLAPEVKAPKAPTAPGPKASKSKAKASKLKAFEWQVLETKLLAPPSPSTGVPDSQVLSPKKTKNPRGASPDSDDSQDPAFKIKSSIKADATEQQAREALRETRNLAANFRKLPMHYSGPGITAQDRKRKYEDFHIERADSARMVADSTKQLSKVYRTASKHSRNSDRVQRMQKNSDKAKIAHDTAKVWRSEARRQKAMTDDCRAKENAWEASMAANLVPEHARPTMERAQQHHLGAQERIAKSVKREEWKQNDLGKGLRFQSGTSDDEEQGRSSKLLVDLPYDRDFAIPGRKPAMRHSESATSLSSESSPK